MSWFSDSIREFFRKGDLLLLALCLLASGYGMLLIYSATRYMDSAQSYRSVMVQGAAILLGVLIYILLSSVDIELFAEKGWKPMLAFNVVVNLLVRTPLGVEAGGNRSWVHIPGFPVNLQPAELAKLTFVLLLARQIVHLQHRGISRPTSVMQLAGHTIFMFGLIAVTSGDFGMGLTYLLIFVIMAWVGGVKKRWFVLGLAVCVLAVAVVWPRIDGTYFVRRVLVVIDHLTGNSETIYEQTRGAGWQQTRSILAIGSGGLLGQGWRKGVQTQSTYEENLPARHTDEIFAVCGEEFGLLGCLLLLGVLMCIILRCIWVARRACSSQSALIAVGYAGMLMVQVGVNVGMCLYAFPVVGLTLPFISYGGSSIVTMYAAMGVVSGIKMRSLPSWLRDRSKI